MSTLNLSILSNQNSFPLHQALRYVQLWDEQACPFKSWRKQDAIHTDISAWYLFYLGNIFSGGTTCTRKSKSGSDYSFEAENGAILNYCSCAEAHFLIGHNQAYHQLTIGQNQATGKKQAKNNDKNKQTRRKKKQANKKKSKQNYKQSSLPPTHNRVKPSQLTIAPTATETQI